MGLFVLPICWFLFPRQQEKYESKTYKHSGKISWGMGNLSGMLVTSAGSGRIEVFENQNVMEVEDGECLRRFGGND